MEAPVELVLLGANEKRSPAARIDVNVHGIDITLFSEKVARNDSMENLEIPKHTQVTDHVETRLCILYIYIFFFFIYAINGSSNIRNSERR